MGKYNKIYIFRIIGQNKEELEKEGKNISKIARNFKYISIERILPLKGGLEGKNLYSG